MPVRVPHHQVVVHRDGKNIYVPIGKPFDFTTAEVHEIHGFHPHALRRIINESRPMPEVTSDDAPVVEADELETAPVATRAAPRKAAPKRAAVATDEDDEL